LFKKQLVGKMTKKEERKTPFFEKIGKYVTRHYKKILLIWVVLIAGAIYPAIRLKGVLSYNEMDFLPKNLEYHQGRAIFEEYFPTNATGNTIIVMQSEEAITSEKNLEYIRLLTERIYQQYNESIHSVQSILTVFDEYNNSYWGKINDALSDYYDALAENITTIHLEMYNILDEKEELLKQIALHYSLFWFNFSRTVFYGHFNTTLFSTGANETIYQIIGNFTDYSSGQAILSSFIDKVFTIVNTTLAGVELVNDTIIHDIAFQETNTTIYDYLNQTEGITLEQYIATVYPLLEVYVENWAGFFSQCLTANGTTIVDGETFTNNLYENSTQVDAFQSQAAIWRRLEVINESSFTNISLKAFVINATLTTFDLSNIYDKAAELLGVSSSEIADYFEPYIPIIVESIYDLGRTPTQEDILAVTDFIIEIVITIVTTILPPPSSVEDMPFLLSQWFVSEDGRVSLVLITYNSFNKTSDEIEDMINTVDAAIGELAHKLAEELQLSQTKIYHTGDDFVMESWVLQAEHDAQRIDFFTVFFVLIILIVIFTSFVAPLIPLIVIGSSIAISMAILWFISFGLEVHFLATLFLTVTSLGAGVDYCIFIFSRYEEERKNGLPKEEAIIIAVKYAGESVFHSGLTVIIGFGALIIPNFPLLRILGVSMCIGISISIFSAILVVPSIVLLLGDYLWWPKWLQKVLRPQKWFLKKQQKVKNAKITEEKKKERPEGTPQTIIRKREPQKKEKWLIRFGRKVTKNGFTITILSIMLSVPFLYFAFTMNTSTDMLGMLPKDFEGTIGRDILSESLAIGDPTATTVIFHNLKDDPLNTSVLADTGLLCFEIARRSKFNEQTAKVTVIKTTAQPLGLLIPYQDPFYLELYANFIEPYVSKKGNTFYIEIFLDENPYDDLTEKFVEELPELVQQIIEEKELETLQGAEVYYIGLARGLYEIKRITDNAFPVVLPIVIIGVYLVLFILFGSYFTPIRLIITISLSIGLTLGVMALVFAFGFEVPIFWLLPLMLFSILMGLGLDYDIFLVTRIKEYYDKGLSNRDAIIHALDHTAVIITSCGTLMATAYATLMFSKLWHLRELGFAFALAIILDATVVRLVIVPAIMMLMEKWNWIGPKKLMRARHYETESKEIGKNTLDQRKRTEEKKK